MGGLVSVLCATALLWFSDTAMEAALRAAQVFVQSVMPALFPMMVVSRMLPVRPDGNPVRMFVQTAAFACLSGSPASAQRAADSGLTGAQMEKLLCAVGVMSPMFFTGTLAQWCQSREMGVRMLLAHWLGAWLTAWLWRPSQGGGAGESPLPSTKRPSLGEAIAQSARALLSVCGAMMMFSIVAGVVQHALALMLPQWTQTHAPILAVGWAIVEIGGGARAVVDSFAQPPGALLCALCSFGGLSVWLQNLLFVGNKIRPAKLLCMRALHGALACGIYSLISFL